MKGIFMPKYEIPSKFQLTSNYDLIDKWKLLGLIQGDPFLKPIDRQVAYFLLDHCNTKKGLCYPSHELLAKEAHCCLRSAKSATRRLCLRKWFTLLQRGRPGRANDYWPAFNRVEHDKDVKKYKERKGVNMMLKKVQRSAPQTINETLYKTKGDKEKELLRMVSFVKRGQRILSISNDMVEEMFRRQLITEREYKNW